MSNHHAGKMSCAVVELTQPLLDVELDDEDIQVKELL